MYAKSIFLVVILSLIGLHSVHSQNCEERQAQAEVLLRTLLRIDRAEDRAIQTPEQFSEYCKSAKEGLRQFKAYGKCVNGIGKQIFGIMKVTAAKALRNHCVVNPKVSLQYLSCFSDVKLTHKYRKCLYKFGANLNYAAEKAEESDIFSSICCGFNSLSSCLDETFKSNGDYCTDPSINLRSYAKGLFKGLFGSVTDTFCSSYTPDVCKSRLSKMQHFSQESKNAVSTFSVVSSLIKLSEKLSA